MSTSHPNDEQLFIRLDKSCPVDNALITSSPSESVAERSRPYGDLNEKVLKSASTTIPQVAPVDYSNAQLIDSSGSCLRRGRSVASDDGDFQLVSYKKPKPFNTHSNITSRSPKSQHHDAVPVFETINMSMNIANPIVTTASTDLHSSTTRHQQPSITSASARYALTRFPFPPHIVRFTSNKVSISNFKEDIVQHFKSNHNVIIDIVHCRTSTAKCTNIEMDVLVYVKDSTLFAFLLDHSKWPSTICGDVFQFPSLPSIPPQLSCIVKNVDLRVDFNEFTDEIKSNYPDVRNVIRMKNKFGNDIKLVKLELTSPKARADLLSLKKIYINYICYDIDEYLAPVNVLICSKCCGLGHFRRQCPEQAETCKSCGQSVMDVKTHRCSSLPKCKHCDGEHPSNSMKCSVVKSFRADLTRRLLNTNNVSLSSSASIPPSSSYNTVHNNPSDFPRLTVPWMPSVNPTDSKLNDLISGLARVNESLIKLHESSQAFQRFIEEKNAHNMAIIKEIDHLKSTNCQLESDLTSLKNNYHAVDESMQSHDNMFKNFLFPVLNDILKFISAMNIGKGGRPLDADLRSRIDRFRAEVDNAVDDKVFF